MARFLNIFWQEIADQRDRWIYWLPLPMAIGIIYYFSLLSEPKVYAGLLAFAALSVPLGLFYRNKAFLYAWLVVSLAIAGFTASQIRTHTLDKPALIKKTYAITIEGKVLEVDPLPKAYRLIIEKPKLVGGKMYGKNKLPERVRVKLKNNDPTVPRAGDIIKLKSILLPLSGPVTPDGFDFQKYAFFKKLGGTGYAIGDVEIIKSHQETFLLEDLRHYIRTHIEKHIKDKDHAAITTALLIGESHGISEQAWEASRLSGIAHLIAISGYHITLVTGVVFFLLRALLACSPYIALRWPIKQISAVGAIIAVIFYLLLIGSPISAQRAVVMACFVMLAIIIGRDPFTLRVASVAAIVLLFFQPESLLGPSFQMSFAAVVALIAFFDSTKEWWRKQFFEADIPKRYSLYIIGCFMTTFVASIAIAPFALFHFSRMSLISGLAANMVADPVSALITMPFGILACFLMPFGLEAIPLWITEQSVRIIMDVAYETASWPNASWHIDAWPAWILVGISFGGFWIIAWRGWIRRLGIIPIALMVACIPFTPRADILISDNAKLFAVRGTEGKLWVSSLRREKFVRNKWTEREGGTGVDVFPDIDDPQPLFLTCDDSRCYYTRENNRVSFVHSPEVAEKSCADSDIIIADIYLDDKLSCDKTAIVIAKKDVRRNGTYALYFEGKGRVRIETSRKNRGIRPWAIY